LKNIPYSDSFNNEELYTVVGLPYQKVNPSSAFQSPNCDRLSHRVAYRVCSRIVFKKSVAFFGSKIENGSYEKGIESFKNWTDWAEVKIAEYRALNPIQTLTLPKGGAAATLKQAVAPKREAVALVERVPEVNKL
jgi:hypothetical protein